MYLTKFSTRMWHKVSFKLIGLVLWHINHCRLFNANPFYTYKQFYFKQFSLAWVYSLVLCDSQIELLGGATLCQRRPESDGNKEVLRIPQSSSIIGVLPSYCLVSYPGHLLMAVLPFCRDAVGVFCSPSQVDHVLSWVQRVWIQSFFLIPNQ